MNLHWVDWLVIIAFFVISLLISFRYKSIGEKGLSGFFLGGRGLPWYLAGISMVATTFAVDTPLAVTELVAQKGIAGNWLWWCFVMGGMLTVIFFSRLWRRAEVLTELELIDLRYGGKGAYWLRKIKSVYLGLIMNAIVIAWVNKALLSLIAVFFDIPESQLIWFAAGSMLFVTIYSSISGLIGIAVTDAFQFILAMTGCIILAYLVIQSDKTGGISGLKASVPEHFFHFYPGVSSTGAGYHMGWSEFLLFAGVIWWSSWYPGAEPGGGGYVAQRMMSSKNEKHSLLATLFFQVMHYCLRPWPWILVGLAAIVLYPELGPDDKKLGYVMAMRDFLPNGLKGLMLAAFFGAYASTISTQLNWGASYLMNDLVSEKKRDSWSDKEIVKYSRWATLVMMIAGLYVTTLVESISAVWSFVIECGAGLGLVLILRWFWWRINVWSEIAATLTPFAIYGSLKLWPGDPFFASSPYSVFITVAGTTIVWLIVTFLTPPEKEEVLQKFTERVNPMGIWRNHAADNRPIPWMFMAWVGSVSLIIGILFTTGGLLLQLGDITFTYVLVSICGFALFMFGSNKAGLFKN